VALRQMLALGVALRQMLALGVALGLEQSLKMTMRQKQHVIFLGVTHIYHEMIF
jgi:hypothetical protein